MNQAALMATERLRLARAELSAISQTERDSTLLSLSQSRTKFSNIQGWMQTFTDLSAALGVNATRFRTFYDEANGLDSEMFTIEVRLQSTDPADWEVSVDEAANIQTYVLDVDELQRLVSQGQVQAAQPQPTPAPSSTSSSSSSSSGPSIWDKLFSAAPGVATALAPLLTPTPKPAQTTPAPVAKPPAPKPTGLPWWGWGLIGVGTLGVGAGVIAAMRRR